MLKPKKIHFKDKISLVPKENIMIQSRDIEHSIVDSDPEKYPETELSKILKEKGKDTADVPFVVSSLFPASEYLEPLMLYIWRDKGAITAQESPVTVGEAYTGLAKIIQYTNGLCDGFCVPFSCDVGDIFRNFIPYLEYCELVTKTIAK